MQKGQISIDLLFTLLAVVIITISLNNLTQYTYTTHDNINIQTQLDLENERITNLITQTNMIEDLNYKIITQLKKINYLNEKNKSETTYPAPLIQGNELTLRIEKKGEIIQSTKTFSKKENTRINFVEEEVKIVITNE
ncbi:MAG: hypothetical protein ACOX1V_00385 [Candidatus Iainarchaeum sp.]|jgi:hypothetical protein|nr:MAG: hypothetical protein BWY55_00115 [archaeon ADurb.Bin336]